MPWKKTCIDPDDSILQAIDRIDNTPFRVALVVDGQRKLLGTVTDGDVRRGLLHKLQLESPVSQVMNRSPRTARPDEPWDEVSARFAPELLHQIPIVDADGRVIDIRFIGKEIPSAEARNNWVVLMAGGEGRRLRPLTDSTPKPMIKIGGRPIIEIIVESFKSYGFLNFYVSIHYKAEIVRAHLGDGNGLGVNIRYLEESAPLGTAGALSLIPEIHDEPLIVMNADLLTKLNFAHLLDYHRIQGCDATMCVCEYDSTVPFGVAELDENNAVRGIEEKPIYTYFVNAGIYVVNPDIPGRLKNDQPMDMPQFLEDIVKQDGRIMAFPIREYWLDVGNLDNLELAKAQFEEVFGAEPA